MPHSYDSTGRGTQPMRIQARPNSPAEQRYYRTAGLPGTPWPTRQKQPAANVSAAPLHDLMFHGGRIVPAMEFQNIFLGGSAAWRAGDIQHIDDAIKQAMQDKRLNTVLRQYFHGTAIDCGRRDKLLVASHAGAYGESEVQDLVVALYDNGDVARKDMDHCLFNVLLPPGAELRLDDATSLAGLGGYHGSVHIERDNQPVTLYYSANVYSELLDNKENGIVAFDQPWKNVVATLYHELNEFRTDPDVGDAIREQDNDFLGWTSRDGREIGDQPILDAGNNLMLVFKEILDATRTISLPVQLMYSNRLHGAEDPTLG